MPQRILVADADAASREFVTSHLAEAGWAVTAASDGASALAEVQAQRPHLMVLDLALPEISGIEICRRVRFGADTATLLTPLEFKLLAFFVANRGRVHSREALLARVWNLDPEVETRTVDTYVKRLRAKLGEARPLIETLRGFGYRLRDTTTRW